ncbi:TadE/TadG family type IV pilus assembly protein [Sphingobium sp. CR2-8]|uniref:TadE/TadG family type IV pilus assembly protein n=1 Tax=Sphingobium sp. CR2-8 TaxID=1306534 RepID=UPI002DBDF920|nr:TadE/TadG family type IV pilus assembly protein [Sphingobium sp. CR2-8]MEC3910891.1 TadE/TadG family type IV pilus assembly protein [Sphingobium sp. CR2-8]
MRAMFRNRVRSAIADQSGVSAVEFALGLPVLIALTMGGAEAANMAYTSQQLGDIATMSADSVGRVKESINNGTVTDILSAMKTISDKIDLRNRGRIIVSSIQPVVNDAGNVTNQKLRWQRCTGALVKSSAYSSTEGALLGADGIVVSSNRKIAASKDNEMIFVEVYYTYRPLISSAFLGTPQMSAIAAISVRERSNNDIGAGGTVSSCSTYAA